MARVVLFDIDGTMLTGGGSSRAAFISALSALYGDIPTAFELDVRGQTDPALFERATQLLKGRGSTPQERARFYELFISVFEQEIERATNFRVFPGVREVLQLLSQHDDIFLGVQTGNLQASAHLKLKRGGLDTHFEFGGYGSDHSERSEIIRHAIERASQLCGEDLTCNQVAVVGDTPFDVHAAKKHGYRVLAVQTGGFSETELSHAGADLILADLSDVSIVTNFLSEG